MSYGTLAQVALQADRRHWDDFWVALGGSLSRTFLPPLLYFAAGGALGWLYAGFGLHSALFAALALLLLRRSPRPPPAGGEKPALLPATFTGPMFNLLAAVNWALTGLNRWVVALFFGPAMAGYFTLATNIAFIVPGMLGTIFSQYFLPVFVALPHDSPADRLALARQIDRVAVAFWFLALAGTAGVHLLLPALIGPLIDPQYGPAADFVLPAGCFFTALVTTHFYQQLLIATRHERACGPVELSFAGVLVLGGLVSASFGLEPFRWWLLATPLSTWLVARPLARRHIFPSPP